MTPPLFASHLNGAPIGAPYIEATISLASQQELQHGYNMDGQVFSQACWHSFPARKYLTIAHRVASNHVLFLLVVWNMENPTFLQMSEKQNTFLARQQ